MPYPSLFSRSVLICGWLLSIALTAKSQQQVPTAYPASSKVNLIRAWDARRPETNSSTFVTRPLKDVQLTTTYYDGLGRPLQTVARQGASPTREPASDRVSAVLYDEFGREQVKYLPFAANASGGNTSTNDGLFKLNPFQQQQTFMQQQYGSGESWYYGITDFEASPLNRVKKTYAPGNDWAGSSTSSNPALRHSIKTAYKINTLADDVKKWIVTDVTNNWGTYAMTGGYPTGELYKKITTDEQSHQVIEFSDKDGSIILKKVQLTASSDNGSGSGYSGWACTYYIYDNLNNLRLVIQPEGVNLLSTNGWNLNASDILGALCFRYEYDARKRLIRKKVPGAEENWMIYDARDRLVMTQDGNRHNAHQWLYTQYDQLNRPVATGLLTDNANYNNLQHHLLQAYTSTAYPDLSGQTYEELTRTFYDDYAWRGQYGNPLSSSRSTLSDSYLMTPSNVAWPYPQAATQSNVTRGMVTGTRTKVLGTGTYLYSVSFYDAQGRVIQTQATNLAGGTDVVSTQYNFAGSPLLTITHHEKPGAHPVTLNVATTFTYDDLGRLSTVSKRLNGTVDGQSVNTPEQIIVSNKYNALGELITKNLHKTGQIGSYVNADPAVGQPGVTYGNNIDLTNSTYNSAQHTYIASNRIRLLPNTHISGSNLFTARIGYSQQDADAHNNTIDEQSFLQSVDYRYNIRGWLSQINGVETSESDDLFSMDLKYNTPQANGGPAQYNGNISQVRWKGADGETKSYGYYYDFMNRLTDAQFYNEMAPTQNGRFNEKIGNSALNRPAYDLNGNIRNLFRQGKTGTTTYGLMDDLSYEYAGSNKLFRVMDGGANGEGFKDDVNIEEDNDYAYDANGNMIIDLNKNIGSSLTDQVNKITYNYMNLPERVQKSSTEYIQYTYDATGRKLKQVALQNGVTKTTDYAGDFIYENDVLQFIQHEEGRVVMTGPEPEYQYHLKDHLGNVRLTFTTKEETESFTATLEPANATAEQANFLRLETARKVYSPLFDRTNGSSLGYAERLNGTANERYGIARSISVMPGDVVKAEVYAKYVDQDVSHHNEALAGFLAAVATGQAVSSGKVVDGAGYANSTPSFDYAGLLNKSGSSGNGPRAYLNWLIFDHDYNLITGGYQQMSEQAKEHGQNTVHEKLSTSLSITKAGYVYIYLSNEESTPVEVFFDDLTVQNVSSRVVQMDDYYPFGLTFNSYQRENSVENKYKFQGQEHIDDLGLGWDSFKWRNHQPDIGRFFNIDPLASDYVHNSPYAFSENKVTNHIELEGLESYPAQETLNREIKKVENVVMPVVNKTVDGVKSMVNSIGDGIAGVWNSIAPGEGRGGSVYSTKESMGNDQRELPKGQVSGESEVSGLIGPTLPTNPATTFIEGMAQGIEMVTTIESKTHVIEGVMKETGGNTVELKVESIQDTTMDSQNFMQLKVRTLSGKDSVIQTSKTPDKQDEPKK